MTSEWLPIALGIGAWCVGSLLLGLYLSSVLHRRSREAMPPARPDPEVERARLLIELADQIEAHRDEHERRGSNGREAS
jgi:hypothetical protein